GAGENTTSDFFRRRQSKGSWSAIKILIVINVICFGLQYLLVEKLSATGHVTYFVERAWDNSGSFYFLNHWFSDFMAMAPVDVFSGKVWKLFTSMFVHGNFFHIFFNLFALWSFGSSVEKYIGKHKFLILYFFSGFIGAFCYLLSEMNSSVPCLGASAAVCGTVLVSALLFPDYKVFLFFIPIPIAIRKFIKYFIIGSLILIVTRRLGVTNGTTAHVAHLGGFLGGWIYFKYLLKRPVKKVDIFQWLSNFKARFHRRRFVRKVDEKGKEVVEPKDVDYVLDKISRSGIGSLTSEEKAVLEAARKNLRK
ncbi:MAG: rhomboid family intramembrane serine protease, partial [Lentisphaeria bacterium]